MRSLATLIFVCLFSVTLVAETLAETSAETIEDAVLVPYRAAELTSEEWSTASSHLVVLGSLEKVNRVLQPEKSEVVSGRKLQQTFFLPEARSTEQVVEHYRAQLASSGELLFQCDGRGCGSSSYWANKVFEVAILYGPEQFQKYVISRPQGTDNYVAVYVGQRATGKIYVHIVRYLVEG